MENDQEWEVGMMSRTWITVTLAMGIALVGCQKAKMKSVQPEATPTASAAPTNYGPPPGPNQPIYVPPQSQNDQQPVIVHHDQPPQNEQPVYQPTVVDNTVTVNLPNNDQGIVREWYEVRPPVRGELVLPVQEEQPPLRVVEVPAPIQQEDCRENMKCAPPEPEPGQCLGVELNAEKEMTKLDILFVVDTSASLNGGTYKGNGGELAQLARDVDNFVQRLNPETDYQIAVLLGHGSYSPYHAKLYSAGKGDPVVIKFQEIYRAEARAGGNKEAIRKRTSLRIAQMLEAKMLNLPSETDKLVGGKPSAQGEALLLSMYNSLTQADKFVPMQNQGFFRQDAGLAVISITDEQDVCFNYEGSGFSPRLKQKKTKAGIVEVEDAHEVRFFNEVCKTAVNGQMLTPAHVYDALEKLKGEKLVVTGVVYLNNDIPPQVEDENEMAHGILELISLAHSKPADLAMVDRTSDKISFADQLQLLGDYTHFKLRYNNTFACKSNTHALAVNPTSIELTIVDKKTGQPVATFSGRCEQGSCDSATGPVIPEIRQVGGRHGKPYLQVSVPFEAMNSALTNAKFEEGVVHIKFMTKSDVDPRTGRSR